MSKKHIGSGFDEFLAEEGILDEVEAKAIKATIAAVIQQQLEREHITKTEFAKKLHTSRTAVDRLLDPANTSVTLRSIIKAIGAVGRKIELSIV